jgi:CHASE3 domain sensor protein
MSGKRTHVIVQDAPSGYDYISSLQQDIRDLRTEQHQQRQATDEHINRVNTELSQKIDDQGKTLMEVMSKGFEKLEGMITGLDKSTDATTQTMNSRISALENWRSWSVGAFGAVTVIGSIVAFLMSDAGKTFIDVLTSLPK